MDWHRRNRWAAAFFFVVFYAAILQLRDAGSLPVVGGVVALLEQIGR